MLILLATATLTVARSRNTGFTGFLYSVEVPGRLCCLPCKISPCCFFRHVEDKPFCFISHPKRKTLSDETDLGMFQTLAPQNRRWSKNTQLSTALISASALFAGLICLLSMTSSYIIVLIFDTYTIEPMEWSYKLQFLH